MKVAALTVGTPVWFRPQVLGYGYDYAVDHGIPATVARVPWLAGAQGWMVAVTFTPKHSDEPLTRNVVVRNVTRRDA